MLILLLMSCRADVSITNAPNAPFELSELASQIWVESPENTRRYGEAMLFLASDGVSCGQLTQRDLSYQLDQLVIDGEGLFFYLRYYQDGSPTAPFDYAGLWTGGYSRGLEEGVDRMLITAAFAQGSLYIIDSYYSGGGSWLLIDRADNDGVSGSFATEWWWGEFGAQSCGDWAGQAWDTGGYDTDWGHTGDTSPARDLGTKPSVDIEPHEPSHSVDAAPPALF